MEKRKPGRPKNTRVKELDELIDEDGNPISQDPHSKQQLAIQFAKSTVPDAQRMQPNRGMYAGMANPHEYLVMYRTAANNPRKGRPWTYPSAAALAKEVDAYFDFCTHRRIAVCVAGLGAWLGVTVSTLRNWKQNRDTMPFYEVVEPAIAFIHAMIEQGALDGTVPAIAYIFQSKNYNGLKDVQEYTVEPRQQLSMLEQDKIIEALPDE